MKPQVWLVLLGWALPSLGITVLELEQQIQELKKTLQQEYTEKINAHYEKALAPLKQQEEAEKKAAITHLEYFLEHDFKSPQRPDALLSLTNLYFDLDLPKSIHWLKLFILQYPESKHLDAAYYMLGIAYLYESHLEETEQTFQYFLKNFKESAYAEEIRFRLAELYFEQNNYPAAASSLEPILENSKNKFYSKALYKYAWIAYLENNYSKAIEEFSRLLELDSGSNEILDKEATRYIAKSLLENSKNPAEELGSQKWARSVLIHLGDLYIKADKTTAAAHAFQKAIALDPKNPNNRELDFKIFALTPSIEIQKNLVAQYLDKSILLDLAVKLHKEKLYREAAGYYALFINQFPEADDLEQVIFYYAEACFDATQYAYAATGFEQVRDWPHPTEYRERAALNAVYAHAQAIKQAFPDYELSAIHLANKGLMQGPIPEAMLGYIQATDILAADFKTLPETPSLLFQAAGIYWDYGET
ncbi:MAG: tetratricopeptide repeat protein, partial [Myxococcaceae bacterium]